MGAPSNRLTRNEVMRKVSLIFVNQSSITFEEMVQQLERLLLGTHRAQIKAGQAAFISKVGWYQEENFGVVSPAFIYSGVDMAAEWRYYILLRLMDLRKLEKLSGKDSPIRTVLDSKIGLFQDHIDSVDSILEGYYGVNSRYRSSKNFLDKIDFEVMNNLEYALYKEMIQEVEQILDQN